MTKNTTTSLFRVIEDSWTSVPTGQDSVGAWIVSRIKREIVEKLVQLKDAPIDFVLTRQGEIRALYATLDNIADEMKKRVSADIEFEED